jgi:hydrogenase nickel incorporation protein HypA/HybF
MHELGIANSVLEAVRTEIARHPGVAPVKVGMRIGELAGVDPDALQFSFEALTRGTDWEGLVLEIETCARQNRCPACGLAFRVIDYCFACPACGESRTESISGDELDLKYLELEDG